MTRQPVVVTVMATEGTLFDSAGAVVKLLVALAPIETPVLITPARSRDGTIGSTAN
jgi:hypothetical protein